MRGGAGHAERHLSQRGEPLRDGSLATLDVLWVRLLIKLPHNLIAILASRTAS
jgi:hypothetical protein